MLSLSIVKNAYAYDFSRVSPSGHTLYYELSSGGAKVVNPGWSTNTTPVGDLIIPSTVTYIGYTFSVTAIGAMAFKDCSGLSSVILPNTITNIGISAFQNCTGLDSITIPNSTTIIGSSAFQGCTGLISVVLPDSITTINSWTFEECSNLLSIVIPGTVTQILNGAFYHCSSLSSIVIPEGVTRICSDVFFGDSNLISVTIPNSVTFIGWSAFNRCVSLSSIVLPSSIDTIDRYAFSFCYSLRKVYVLSSTPPTLGTSVFSDTPTNKTIYVPCGSTLLYQNVWGTNNYSEQWVPYNVTIAPNNNDRGAVEFVGNFCDSSVTITATPNYGYYFSQWRDGDTNNPRIIHLFQDTIAIAEFFPNQYTLMLVCNNDSLGTTEGAGIYNYMDTIEISATAMDHYHFVHWSDGNTDNPRQYIVTGNATLTATFAIDSFHVSVASNNIAYGGVSGEGDYQYGTPATVTATAYTGYHFSQWSNGITANPYTFAALQDTELTAIFVEDGTQGIDIIESSVVHVYQQNGKIVVSGGDKDPICLYDIYGRLLAVKQVENSQLLLDVPVSGIYFVKVGNHPSRKIIVIK